jgi:hypothetical protein
VRHLSGEVAKIRPLYIGIQNARIGETEPEYGSKPARTPDRANITQRAPSFSPYPIPDHLSVETSFSP